MTLDLYGHLIDSNLWSAADRISARGHHGGHDNDTTLREEQCLTHERPGNQALRGGAASGNRTPDLLITSETLCRLS